jgi:hypothetical protein
MRDRCLLIMVLFILFIGCGDKNTIRINNFLKAHNHNIDNYKVICIVPVEGCAYCIDPSLKYAMNVRNDFLLILSARYAKSFDITTERLKFHYEKSIFDSINLAYDSRLVSEFSPCYYFLRYGKVVKKVDLSKYSNKEEIIGEVGQFFIQEDIHLNRMQLYTKKKDQ